MIKLVQNRTFTGIMTLVIALEIFLFSTIKTTAGTNTEINLALFYHLGIFFVFTFFLFLTIKGKEDIKIKYIIWTLIIALVYAISDEVHQLFVPGRVASIRDVLIDLIGITTAIISNLIIRIRNQ